MWGELMPYNSKYLETDRLFIYRDKLAHAMLLLCMNANQESGRIKQAVY